MLRPILVAFLASTGTVQAVFAQQARAANPYGRDIEFSVALRERVTPLGEIALHIDKNGVLSVSPIDLATALGQRITPQAVTTLLQLQTQNGRADFQALQNIGFILTFNEADLDLSIAIPLSARPKLDYSVMGPQRRETGDYDPVSKFSLAANLRFLGDYSRSEFGEATNSSGSLNILGRVAGVAYQSDYRFSDVGGGLQRDRSNIIFDDVKRALRWQFGDVQPFSSSTVGGDDVFGIGVSRETDALQPDQITRVRGTQVFSIEEPSEVTVSVNGRVVSRTMFAPGNYNIADFPYVLGRNQVDLDILSQAGKREQLSFNQFLDSRLLEVGRSDFGSLFGSKHLGLWQSAIL